MVTVQITLRNLPASDALEALIRKRIDKLSQFFARIMSCRVVIETPQNHKHQGKLYNVRIDITVPRKEFAVTYKSHEDIYIAIRDSFAAIERKLEEHSRKKQGRIKNHSLLMHGHVVKIFPQQGYGFIEGVDGNEYYFSITNVSFPTFEQLKIGDAVEYIPTEFSDGHHAHHVTRSKENHVSLSA